MAQLLRVGHGPDRLHLAIEDVKGDDGDEVAVGVAGQETRLAVHPGRPQRRPGLDGPGELSADDLGHPLAGAHGRDDLHFALAAAVPVEAHVGGEPLEQAGHVAAVGRGQEQAGDLRALGARGLDPWPALAVPAVPDALLRPGEDLPAGGLGLAGDLRELWVAVAEHLAEQEYRALR